MKFLYTVVLIEMNCLNFCFVAAIAIGIIGSDDEEVRSNVSNLLKFFQFCNFLFIYSFKFQCKCSSDMLITNRGNMLISLSENLYWSQNVMDT